MLSAVEYTVQAISCVVQTVPIGTNIALMGLLWTMITGGFLPSRGALFPAMTERGFETGEVRRIWAALRYGSWASNELLENWRRYVASENQWRARRHEGWQAMSVDMTGFWRARLQGWHDKHYHSLAQRSLTAVVLGVMVSSGELKGKRVPMLHHLVRSAPGKESVSFRSHLLAEARKQVTPQQVIVVDAEFEIRELEAAQIKHYVVRLASNATARRNQLPLYKGRGARPQWGEVVRPLARKWKDRDIAASAPDQLGDFVYERRHIAVSAWHHLVRIDTVPSSAAHTFSIYAFTDPLFKQPLLVATNLTNISPQTAYLLYRDRWTAEHPPLAAKQMIGLHRQFVFSRESCFRLPELSLIAGSILTYTAACLPPIPSGFWDRTPKPTPGRLRRLLAHAHFPTLPIDDRQLRKKNSVTHHLPKGFLAHCRHKLLPASQLTGN